MVVFGKDWREGGDLDKGLESVWRLFGGSVIDAFWSQVFQGERDGITLPGG